MLREVQLQGTSTEIRARPIDDNRTRPSLTEVMYIHSLLSGECHHIDPTSPERPERYGPLRAVFGRTPVQDSVFRDGLQYGARARLGVQQRVEATTAARLHHQVKRVGVLVGSQ